VETTLELKKATDLEKIYTLSGDSVRRLGLTATTAKDTYSAYVQYLNHYLGDQNVSLLDVGCGNGWSSHFLANTSRKVTGLDLHKDGFEPEVHANLTYKQSSAMNIDFEQCCFDVVATHECLEHVPDPVKALNEFDRVLKPGGYVIIVGPNLLSVLQSVRGVFSYVWKNRPLSTIFIRNASMPHHPHGNTLSEILYNACLNIFSILRLYFGRKPLFQLREPDLTPPFFADNDACYYLNPLDLKYFFEEKGYEVLNISGIHRPPWLAMVPSGTWFAARKPS
jgi:SAM-dependent methyltransferase